MKNNYRIIGDIVEIDIICQRQIHKCIIDIQDFTRISSIPGTWSGRLNGMEGCMQRIYVNTRTHTDTGYGHISIHRMLTNAPEGMLVDHINHNTLDNRRSNLRIVTDQVNSMNKEKAMVNSKSGIRGVSWHKQHKKWKTKVMYKGKEYSFGYYHNLLDATMAVVSGRNQLYQLDIKRVPITGGNTNGKDYPRDEIL